MKSTKKNTVPPSRYGQRKAVEIIKTGRITIRFSEQEKSRILARAAKLGNSAAEYCRCLILGLEPRDKSPEERQFQRVISGVANNLRQIAKEMHTHGLNGQLLSRLEKIIADVERH